MASLTILDEYRRAVADLEVMEHELAGMDRPSVLAGIYLCNPAAATRRAGVPTLSGLEHVFRQRIGSLAAEALAVARARRDRLRHALLDELQAEERGPAGGDGPVAP